MRTLLSLSERAEAAVIEGGPLDRLARELAGQAGAGTTVELASVKGFRRALQKAHKECSGDYLRLNDMARCIIICPKLTTLVEGLRWLLEDAPVWALDDPALPKFETLLIKDRLSPNFDADGLGMYRYVLIVGRLTTDGGALLNVEIQLHVKRLFEARKRLSILYDGRKSLGAFDDSITRHEGELTKDAIGRAAKGVLTRLECPDMNEPVSIGTREALQGLLQTAPCFLAELNLSGSDGLHGIELGDGLLLPPGGAPLQCTGLRVIKLARLKLSGELPKALFLRCVWLRVLELQDNWLRGKIPDAVGQCKMLETLALHGNALEGEVPAVSIVELRRLTLLTLGGDLGGNDELWLSPVGLRAIESTLGEQADLYLPKRVYGEADRADERAKEVAAEAAEIAEHEEQERQAARRAEAKAAKERKQKATEMEKAIEEKRAEVELRRQAEAKEAADKAAQEAAQKAYQEAKRKELLEAEARREAEERALDAQSQAQSPLHVLHEERRQPGGTSAGVGVVGAVEKPPAPRVGPPRRKKPPKILQEGDVFIDPMEVKKEVKKRLSQVWVPPSAQDDDGDGSQAGVGGGDGEGDGEGADDAPDTPAPAPAPEPVFIDPLSRRKSHVALSGWGGGDEAPKPAKLEPPKRKAKVKKWPPDPEPSDDNAGTPPVVGGRVPPPLSLS